MKRRIYIICQKRDFDKGTPQVISDGHGKLEHIYASKEGLDKAQKMVGIMNAQIGKQPVHLREATMIIGKEAD